MLISVCRISPECVLNLPGMRGQDAEDEKESATDGEDRPADGEDDANVG